MSLPIHGTPVKRKERAMMAESSTGSSVTKLKESATYEMKDPGSYLGPMPLDEFLDEFLPGSNPPVELLNIFTEMKTSYPNEKLMKEDFMAILDKKLHPDDTDSQTNSQAILTGMKLVPNYEAKDSHSKYKGTPDMSCYDDSVDTSEKRTQFDKMNFFAEFKRDKAYNPFHDPKDVVNPTSQEIIKFIADSDKATQCRSQLVVYASEINSRQHRRHQFSLYMCTDEIRIFRWDQAGVIVTRAFTFQTGSAFLVKFLWRFSRSSRVQQGFDPTVVEPNDEERAVAKERLAEWVQSGFERSVRKIAVFDEDRNEYQYVLTWYEIAERASITGRATRAMPCLRIIQDDKEIKYELAFLKDYWRHESLSSESDILKTIRGAEPKIAHVPSFLCGGDIKGDETVSQRYKSKPWACVSLQAELPGRRRLHHRFLTKEVGIPLRKFSSTKQMHIAILHALEAHRDVFTQLKILHRDVSGNNILILPDGSGLLNDWDMSRHIDDLKNGPSQRERTGTWEFMSARLLANPPKVHEVQDDMESFIHVQLYHCLRYSEHTLSSSETLSGLSLKDVMERIYHSYTYTSKGLPTGGEIKKNLFFVPNGVLGEAFDFTASPLTSWFASCIEVASEWLLTMERSLGKTKPVMADKLALRNHDALIEIWRETSAHPDWPEGDKAVDQIPNLDQKCGSKRKTRTDNGTSGWKRGKSNTGTAIHRTVSSLQQIAELEERS